LTGASNFLDNSWDYNDGASEIRMGKALRDGYRKKVFLMNERSTAGRNPRPPGSSTSPLRRLQTDCIDLVQHHEMLRFEDRTGSSMTRGAQRRCSRRARLASWRFIGFTGHKDPRSTCTRSRSPRARASPSTPCKCR